VPEVDVVLDTDVLSEVLRGADQAKAWLASNASNVIGIPIFVRMEILPGARVKREQHTLSEDMPRYTILHLETGDSPKAQRWFEQFHLSHGVGILDCFIATFPVRLLKPFYTFNLKNFRIIPGLDARAHTADASHLLRE
jgi:predicted nucleic acid-binding protein